MCYCIEHKLSALQVSLETKAKHNTQTLPKAVHDLKNIIQRVKSGEKSTLSATTWQFTNMATHRNSGVKHTQRNDMAVHNLKNIK